MSENNLWVKEVGDEWVVGLTKAAQDDLGSISFVLLPKVNTSVNEKNSVIEIEAEKAVVEYESPVSGVVTAINEDGLKNTELLNHEGAWLFKVKK